MYVCMYLYMAMYILDFSFYIGFIYNIKATKSL